MKLDDIHQYIGGIGLYQVLMFVLVGVMQFFSGLQNMSINFASADQQHWCRVPRLESYPHAVQKYVAIPYEDDSADTYDSCRYYDLDYDRLTDEAIRNWNRTTIDLTNVTRSECEGWVFDQSEFVSTINSKHNLVCGRAWMSRFVSTAYAFGILFGSAFSGMISDRFGRFKPMIVGCVGHIGFGFGEAFAPNYPVFVVMRFLTGAFNNTAYLSSFVILTEFVGTKYRTALAVIYHMYFSIGIMVSSGVAYAVRDDTNVFIIASGVMFSTIPFIWTIPESPRWLISKGQYKKAEKILRYVAAVNGKSLPEKIDWSPPDTEKSQLPEASDTVTFRQVCQSRILCGELALMYLNWFTTSMVYYGLGLNAGAFGGLFLNNFLNGLIEIPALLLCVLCLTRGSKRFSNAGCLLVAGAFCVSCVPVIVLRDDLNQLLIALSTIGKGAITFSYGCIYLISAEMFPTTVRQKAVGTSSVFARIGSMASPFMGPPMEEIWKPMPSLLFGVIAIFTGCMVLMLPDTRGHKLPDTVEEAEYIGRYRKPKKTTQHEAMNGSSGVVDKSTTSYDNKAFAAADRNEMTDKSQHGGVLRQDDSDEEFFTKL